MEVWQGQEDCTKVITGEQRGGEEGAPLFCWCCAAQEWEEKVQQLKRSTGRLFVDMEAPLPLPPSTAAADPAANLNAAVEARFQQMARR